MVQTVQMYVFVQFLYKVGDLPVAPLETPQVQFFVEVHMPVVVPSGDIGQTAQKTVDFLQLPFIAGRRHPGHGAEADSHGLACSEDHRDSAAQYLSWWSMPLLCSLCSFSCGGPDVQTVVSHSCRSRTCW